MQIHVVQPGQNLYGIAQAYGTTYQEVARVNEIPDPSKLVVGQALVIPIVGKYHWVQPGQTLTSIARLYGVSVTALADANQISPSSVLQVGQRLTIPEGPKRTIDSLLFVEPRATVSQIMIDEVRNRVRSLTYLAMFSYRVNRDGSVIPPAIDDIPTIASNANVYNALAVTNIENGEFSGDLAHAILSNEAVQTTLLGNLIEIANEIGYQDIHFDFEFIKPEDRDLYTQFLRKARDIIHSAGLTLSVAVAPKPSDIRTGIYGAHDYKAIGEIVDFVGLMTYEWGYTYSEPQAVSPISPVRQVVEYAVSQIPREKVMLGQNLYGYDWTAPYPPNGGPPARAISPQQAIAIALRENVAIQYDYRAQAPFFNYIDDAGLQHTVWFEDARSIQAKFNLLKEFNLRGIMYWKLGLSFPQNWLLLEANFNIRKKT